MVRLGSLRRALITAALALAASAGVAAAADLATGDSSTLASSDLPALLGPITEGGRVGWSCPPERAARSERADTADLPTR